MTCAARFVFEKWFNAKAKDFRKQGHAQLREENPCQAKPESAREEGLAEVVGYADPKEVCQHGEEEVERTDEF